jgi:hypothetical protein
MLLPQGLCSQIWALGFFLAVLKLWLELSAATEATTTFNKVVLHGLFFSACEEIPPFWLAVSSNHILFPL